MNRRIKKKHIKQYLEFHNPDSILVFEIDMDKVEFIGINPFVDKSTGCKPQPILCLIRDT